MVTRVTKNPGYKDVTQRTVPYSVKNTDTSVYFVSIHGPIHGKNGIMLDTI